jgi:hypothetical protein
LEVIEADHQADQEGADEVDGKGANRKVGLDATLNESGQEVPTESSQRAGAGGEKENQVADPIRWPLSESTEPPTMDNAT